MVKGDDITNRKKNKAKRKKLNRENSSSNVSARVASIIAAKKRRLSGKRRMCQGMCFSLPTLDDPFNEHHGKVDPEMKAKKKINKKEFVKGKNAPANKDNRNRKNGKLNDLKQKSEMPVNLRSVMGNTIISSKQLEKSFGYSDCPSKFFILCLDAIEKALHHERTHNNEEKPLFDYPWGFEFLKFCSIGKDILETSGSSCTVEQVAWIVSIAADAISRKEKKGQSFISPFLLFLVPSQEKASKVRLVCKPLKELGVHTVSLHPGASLDHQIHGLKSCEPEFIVATPERLMELVSLKAIDISGISFLVVDGLDSYQDGSLGALTSIRQSILGNPQTLIFNNSYDHASAPALRNIFQGSICRLSLSDSVGSQTPSIVQTIKMCSSEDEKLSKL